MKVLKKIIVTLALFIGILSGCGTDKNSQEETTPSEKNSENSNNQETTAEKEANDSKNTTITTSEVDNEETNGETSSDTTSRAGEEVEFVVGGPYPGEFNSPDIVIKRGAINDAPEEISTSEDRVFQIYEIEFYLRKGEPIPIGPDNFKLVDFQGNEYHVSERNREVVDAVYVQPENDKILELKQMSILRMAFDVPKELTNYYLKVSGVVEGKIITFVINEDE